MGSVTEVAKQLYSLFSSFGIPAYEENSIPETAVLPYILYETMYLDWQDTQVLQARLYAETSSTATMNAYADTISDKLKNGIYLYTDNGVVIVEAGDPFIQPLPTEEDNLKGLYINLSIQTLT